MKKKLVVGLLSALMVTSSVSTYAASTIQIKIDNKMIETDVAPELKNNTTYVPISFIAKELGANTKWESPKVTIEKNGITLEFEIGKLQVIKNGESYPLTNAPYLLNGRTMVPLRVISEHLGCQVGYDNINKIVSITSGTSQTNNISNTNEVANTNDDTMYIDSRLTKEQQDVIREVMKTLEPTDRQGTVTYVKDGKLYSNRLEALVENCLREPEDEIVHYTEDCVSFDKKWKIKDEAEYIEQVNANGGIDIEALVTLYLEDTKTHEEKKICTESKMKWAWTTDNLLVLKYKDKTLSQNGITRYQFASYNPETNVMTSITEDTFLEMMKDQTI